MDNDLPTNTALLPAGLRDLLPPEAEHEADAVAGLMAVFATHGYERVRPPLLEYEDSLFAGSGGALADQSFRLSDADTHRPMAVRADMTPQVARIAATRLAHAPRPLRLCYAGQCLRVRGGNQVAPERQVAQAGIELIGPDDPAADAEAVLVAVEALASLGVERVSFDLTMPPLVPALLEEAGVAPTARAWLNRALDRKDAAAVARAGGAVAGMLAGLLLAAGPADAALAALAEAALTPRARAHADRLAATVAAIRAGEPALRLTVDPVEFRGFRYHTGVAVAAYAPGRAEELGRGGRYICGEAEPATGLTLYPEAVMRVAPRAPRRPRVYLPPGTDPRRAARLRAEGYATVAGFDRALAPAAAAGRLACTHVEGASGPVPVAHAEHAREHAR